MADKSEKIKEFGEKLKAMESEEFMKLVDTHLGDESVEAMIGYIAEFYKIEDEEDLGNLGQIMVKGALMGLYASEQIKDL